MVFLDNTDKRFYSLWECFVKENSSVSWRYQLDWIKYQKKYSKNYFKKDLSFLALLDNKAVGICPIFLEEYKGILSFTYSLGYLSAPVLADNLTRKRHNKILDGIMLYIDNLACKYKISKSMFMYDPFINNYKVNVLTGFDYIDTTISTRIIKLSYEKNYLEGLMTKGARQSIRAGLSVFKYEVFDYRNINKNIFEQYKQQHFKTAGRKTRSDSTWDIQYEMILKGYGVLVAAKYENKYVGFGNFLITNKKVYYASYADDDKFRKYGPIGHALIWEAINYCKKREFNIFELGWQEDVNSIFLQPDKKETTITQFKKSLGGESAPLFRGVKYYDLELMREELFNSIYSLINIYKSRQIKKYG